MRLVVLSLAAALVSATPALANEARIEGRGGVIWDNGTTEDIWGVAAGYDWDLSANTFAGVEVSGDKIGASNTKVAWGFTGRAGAKVGNGTKLYVDGGYTTEPCDLCEHSWHAGAGVEQPISGNVYAKVAYRHNFVANGFSDTDSVVAGVGMKF